MARVTLFDSAHLGFGDSRRRVDSGRYHRCLNIRAMVPGSIMPAELVSTSSLDAAGRRAVKALEWEDSNGKKFILAPFSERVYKFEDGGFTSDLTSPDSRITDLALHEDGSGNEIVYACFGDDAGIRQRNKAGTWGGHDADVKALFMDALDDGRLVRAVPRSLTGGREASFNISILPKNSNPLTASAWGSNLQVGRPSETITALSHIGDNVVAPKEDGVYVSNPASNTFRNLTPNIEVHPENGLGTRAIPGLGVLVPLANGQLILIDSSLKPRSVGPYDNALPDRNTPWGRLVALTNYGHWVIGAMDVGYRRTQNAPGLTVFTYKAATATWTDVSSAVTDADDSTTAAVAALGDGAAGNNDRILIGADVPIVGIYVEVGTVNTANRLFDDLEYSSSAGWTSAATQYSDGTADFSNSGNVMGAFVRDGVILAPTVDIGPSMTKRDNADTNNTEKYWLRLSLNGSGAGATGFSAGTTIKEVYVVLARPNVGLLANDYTGRDSSSITQRFLIGRPDLSPPLWFDTFAAPGVGRIGGLLISRSRHATTLHGDSLLWAFGGGSRGISAPMLATINLVPGDDPRNVPFVTVASAVRPVFFGDALNFSEETRLSALSIQGDYLQSADTVAFYYRWDHNPWTRLGAWESLPVVVEKVDAAQSGQRFEWAVEIHDAAATEPVVPSLRHIEADFEPTGQVPRPQRDLVTPEEE